MQSCSCSYSKCVCSAIVVLVIDDTRAKHDHSVQDATQSLMLLRVAHSTRMNCGSDSGPTTTHDYWHCPHSIRSGVYASVGRPSGRPIRPLHAAAAGLLLWARRAGDIDRLLHGREKVSAGPCGSGRVRSGPCSGI